MQSMSEYRLVLGAVVSCLSMAGKRAVLSRQIGSRTKPLGGHAGLKVCARSLEKHRVMM